MQSPEVLTLHSAWNNVFLRKETNKYSNLHHLMFTTIWIPFVITILVPIQVPLPCTQCSNCWGYWEVRPPLLELTPSLLHKNTIWSPHPSTPTIQISGYVQPDPHFIWYNLKTAFTSFPPTRGLEWELLGWTLYVISHSCTGRIYRACVQKVLTCRTVSRAMKAENLHSLERTERMMAGAPPGLKRW